MLNREEVFYIDILKDFVHGNKTVEKKDIDWKKLLELARIQNTNGIVFFQCKDFIPKEYIPTLTQLYAAEIYAYGIQMSLTKQITKKFTENDIEYFVIKGPVVSTYYPTPALRTMGDTDIVVKEDKLEKACSIMEELGYKKEEGDKEVAFFKDGKEVEIHTHLIYPSKSRKIEETIICDTAWDYVNDNVLDISFHFMYLMLHIKKHLFGIGTGIRQFLDLAIIMQQTDINFDFIDEQFEKLDLIDYKNTCLSMIAKWFDVGNVTVEITNDFYEEETKKILKNGVHGFENEDNKLNGAFKRMSGQENKLSSKNRIKYLKEIFLPEYETMIKMDSYKFLIGKKYLLPIAWIYRFVLSLVNNKAIAQIKETISTVFLSNNVMEKKQSSRNKWGI